MIKKKNKKLIFIYFVIYLIFVINIIFNIKSFYLWNDESFTFNIIHHGFLSIMTLTSQDFHPFLYYFIVKIGVTPFKSKLVQICILRLISAVPYLILLFIGNITIKHQFSKIISILFMLFIVTMPVLVQNIYQIRMYGWALLFTTVVFLLLDYVYKQIITNSYKSFLWISIFSLFAAYTHYYALISVAIIYGIFLILFVLKKKRIRYILSSIVLNLIFYLPWMHVLLKQTSVASNNYWTPSMSVKYIIKIILSLMSPNLNKRIFFLYSIVIIFVIGYLIFRTLNSDLLVSYIGLSIPFIVIVIGVLLSLIIGHTVLLLRYLEPILGAFWLSLAVIINRFLTESNLPKFNKRITLMLILLLCFGSYTSNIFQINSYSLQFNKTLQVYNRIPKNSKIIYDNPPVMYSSASYLNNNVLLSKTDFKHSWMKIYTKVFNNISYKRSVDEDNNNIFFVRSYKTNNNDTNLSNKFFNSHKKELHKINNIYFPLDGGKYMLYKFK